MASRLICNPAEHPAIWLLSLIQGTFDAFTEGRRNNDLVNWFIAKRLIDLEAGESVHRPSRQMTDAYILDFTVLFTNLTKEQQQSLDTWEEKWPAKIERLVQAYGRIADEPTLYNLWLPMDYDDGIHPEQAVLPGTDVPVHP